MEVFSSNHEIEELTESPGSKINQNLEKKRILPLKKNSIEDDINRLFEAIEIGSSHKGIDRLERRDQLSKRAMKRPMRIGPSGIGISEPVSLKQAFRGLCISQASEMAAVKKRTSRPSASSPGISETRVMNKLHRAVVIESSDAGQFNHSKGGLLEISLVPERSLLGFSEKEFESGNVLRNTVAERNDELQLTEPELKEVTICCSTTNVDSGDSLTCSSSATKPGQRIPQMGEGSLKENEQPENRVDSLSSETIPSTFDVENMLVKSSRRGLMSRQRSRTQNFIKKKVVPKTTLVPESQSPHDRGTKMCRNDYDCCKIVHAIPESLRINGSQEMGHTPEASVISKSPVADSSSKSESLGLDEHVSSKLTNAVVKSREKGEISQSSKSSIGEHSSTPSLSEESYLSGGSSRSGSRPHMSKNLRWEAINYVKKEHKNLSLRHFKLVKKIGGGDIGTVYLSELIGTSCLFAVKVMDKEFLASRNKITRAQTEKVILETLDHPFLPTLYAHFETKKFSCLVMDYCPDGDLHVLRQKQKTKSFPEKATRFYVAEAVLALEYLHMLGVVYRDLKPENVLVREDGHIMLSDFDLSLRCNVNPIFLCSTSPHLTKKTSSPCSNIEPFCFQPSLQQLSCCLTPRFLSAASKSRKQLKSELAYQIQIIPWPHIVVEPTNARSNSFVGTHEYLAPEIIKGEGHGSSVDWWTLGFFLYELLYGKTPFQGSSNEDTLSKVVSEKLKFPQTPMVSSHARDLMRKLLKKEPESRLGSLKGAAEIKQHPFFEGLNWALIRCETPPDITKLLDASKSCNSQPEENACRRDVVVFDMF